MVSLLAARSEDGIHSVKVRHGYRGPVPDASLVLRAGSFCAVLGPRSSGKSALLRLLAGELRLSTRELHLDGRDVRNFAAAALRPSGRDALVAFFDDPMGPYWPRDGYEALRAIHELTLRGITVVAAFSESHGIAQFADHVVVMHGGRIAAQGTPAATLEPQILEAAFALPCRANKKES